MKTLKLVVIFVLCNYVMADCLGGEEVFDVNPIVTITPELTIYLNGREFDEAEKMRNYLNIYKKHNQVNLRIEAKDPPANQLFGLLWLIEDLGFQEVILIDATSAEDRNPERGVLLKMSPRANQ